MAKETEAKIVYSDDGLHATTTTFVTVGEMQYGKEYAYPVIRTDDLTPDARERLLAAYDGEVKKADAALEFGPRNRLAGVAAGKLRSTLVAPSAKSMRTALQERTCKLLGENEPKQATDLYLAIQEADHDELVVLWKANVRENVEADFTRAKPEK